MSKFREIFRGKSKYVTVRAEAEGEQHRREVPDGLWTKCNGCRAMLYNKDLESNLYVCSNCGYHFRISARVRLAQLLDDPQSFEEFDANLRPTNPLDFPEYPQKLEIARSKTGNNDAVVTGIGTIGGVTVVLAVMDFAFMGGSMGSVVGERVTRAFERAAARRLPVVSVSASGGARMQESILSLMQMQKTVAAVENFGRQGLLYISVLSDPTTAGVFGSFASLGDINIAEPGATVGFAGPSVIEATIRKAIPPNLQKAETVFANGFIDRIVPRGELKAEIARLLRWHTEPAPIAAKEAPASKPSSAADPQATPQDGSGPEPGAGGPERKKERTNGALPTGESKVAGHREAEGLKPKRSEAAAARRAH